MVKSFFAVIIGCSIFFLTACGSSSDSQPSNNIPDDNIPPNNPPSFTNNMRLFGGGSHMCGISQNKQVYCWGKDYHGEMGQIKDFPIDQDPHDYTAALTPTKVNGLPNIETMDADYARSCAVDDGGLVWCWGADYVTQNDNYIPEIIPQLNSITRISASSGSICASNQNTDLLCWGNNDYAHLNVEDNNALVETPSLFNWNQLEKSNDFAKASGSSCFLTSGGLPYCLGYNYKGGLGTGSDQDHITEPEAVIVTEGQRFSQISAGFDHFCALDTDKNAFCWGYSLGLDQFINTPNKVEGVEDIIKISSFYEGSCALNEAGEVWCWGKNDSGVLGYKREIGDYWKNQAIQIDLPGKATDIASSEYFNCAVGDESFNEDIYCWGHIASEQYLSNAPDRPERENYSPIALQPYTTQD